MTTNVVETGRTTPDRGVLFLALLVWVGVQVFLYGEFDPVAAVIGVVAVVGAGLVASGRRWGLIAAMVLAAVMLLFDLPMFLGGSGPRTNWAGFW